MSGLELVKDVETREPLDESLVQGIVADCMQNNAVIIGATNRPDMIDAALLRPGAPASRAGHTPQREPGCISVASRLCRPARGAGRDLPPRRRDGARRRGRQPGKTCLGRRSAGPA